MKDMGGDDEWTGELSRWGGQEDMEDIWTGMTSGRDRQVHGEANDRVDREENWAGKTSGWKDQWTAKTGEWRRQVCKEDKWMGKESGRGTQVDGGQGKTRGHEKRVDREDK